MKTLQLLPHSALSDRILDTFPTGAYALSGLLRLMDIVETTSVPTAAVECRAQPRMLINPDFVAQHAATPEKLLMLVMHELHHILLGHTTLFPRLTPEQNFVFDAVINGMLCRMFPGPEYTAFFTDFYPASSFPHCLLRPPPEWPGKPNDNSEVPTWVGITKAQATRIREVHEALYSDAGASYKEVFDLLPALLSSQSQALDGVPLLGGHGADDATGQLENQSPVLFDIVRDLVEQWPQPPDPIRGRSLADVLQNTTVQPKKVLSNRAILRGLIRKVAATKGHGRIARRQVQTIETLTPLPTLSRRTAVLQALGIQPMLYPGVAPWKRRGWSGERVHVYVDVSGSMDSVLRALYAAVLDSKDMVFQPVHLFSTKVVDVTLAQMRSGKCKSTGGTAIECVAEHIATHKVSRALLITDGWVGKPQGAHLETLSRTRLAVAYLGSSTTENDLKAVANHTAHLKSGDSL